MGMSDVALVERLHSEYYTHVPKEEFFFSLASQTTVEAKINSKKEIPESSPKKTFDFLKNDGDNTIWNAAIVGIVIGVGLYLLVKEEGIPEEEKASIPSEPESIETEEVYIFNNIGLGITAIYEENRALGQRTQLHGFLASGDDTYVKKKNNSLLIVCDEQGVEYTPIKGPEGYWVNPNRQTGTCN
jgi:uncharacterized membrane-anchored protein YitT (DUF2179 family)